MGWQQHYTLLAVVDERHEAAVERFRKETLVPNDWDWMFSGPLRLRGDLLYTLALTDAKWGGVERTLGPAGQAWLEFLGSIDAAAVGVTFGADLEAPYITYYRQWDTEWIDPTGNPFEAFLDPERIAESPGDYMHHPRPYEPYQRCAFHSD